MGFRRRRLLTATLVAGTVRPPANYWLGGLAMFPGWLTSELALHLLALTVADALRELIGKRRDRTGLVLAAASAAGLARLIRQSLGAGKVVEQALCDGLGADYPAQWPSENSTAEVDSGATWRQLAMPFVVRNPCVEVTKDVPYGDGRLATLDVYRRKANRWGETLSGAPILIYVHGGMWMFGDKKHEGHPLLLHMAARGWVCVGVNYRLAPKDPFPAQIIDVKRAVAWVREHGAEFGADPSFIAISGGSAGGHLAALAALPPRSHRDRTYQPGFEDADTTIQAAVPNYGIYDFAAASGARHARERRDRFLAKFILKRDPIAESTAFEQASPASRVGPDAPPFFVTHGVHDTGVQVDEARYFVQRLRAASGQPVVYAELPGAQHAFDVFPSIRSAAVLRAVQRFLDWALARHRALRHSAATNAAS